MEQKQFESLVLTSKFETFAQAYIGSKDTEIIFNTIELENQMVFVDAQSNGEFLTEPDLIMLWDSYVEIRVKEQMENGNYTMSLTAYTPEFNCPYNGSIIECDCVDAKRLLKNIISLSF